MEIAGRSLSFTLDDGWSSYGQQEGVFLELNVGSNKPAELQGLIVFLTTLSPGDAVDLLREVPGLNVQSEEASSIGGVSGSEFDLTIDAGEQGVPFFTIGADGLNFGQYGLEPGHTAVLTILDLGGKAVIVSIEAPTADLRRFLPKAQSVIDSFDFEE